MRAQRRRAAGKAPLCVSWSRQQAAERASERPIGGGGAAGVIIIIIIFQTPSSRAHCVREEGSGGVARRSPLPAGRRAARLPGGLSVMEPAGCLFCHSHFAAVVGRPERHETRRAARRWRRRPIKAPEAERPSIITAVGHGSRRICPPSGLRARAIARLGLVRACSALNYPQARRERVCQSGGCEKVCAFDCCCCRESASRARVRTRARTSAQRQVAYRRQVRGALASSGRAWNGPSAVGREIIIPLGSARLGLAASGSRAACGTEAGRESRLKPDLGGGRGRNNSAGT